jgi:hypothetical protein
MTRAQHTQHSLQSYPVYCSAFISENELVLGGGGGSSKSGIKNMLVGELSTVVHKRVPDFLLSRDYTR